MKGCVSLTKNPSSNETQINESQITQVKNYSEAG